MSDWFAEAAHANRVEVQEVLSSVVVDTFAKLIEEGVLVSVGATSDGGALGVTVTLDGRWRRQYFREATDLEAWLSGALEAISSEPRQPPASSARPPRARSRTRAT